MNTEQANKNIFKYKKNFKLSLNDANKFLASIYWLPKLHKKPFQV